MAKIKIHIKVDANGNVKVKGHPKRHTFVKDEDTVTFSSNRRDTAIKFKTSPIAEFRARGVMELKHPQGPFLVIREGKHHIDCGHIVGRTFRQWAETGDDIPIPC